MLHPEARGLIDLMVARNIPPVNTLTPVDARRFYLERKALTQPDAPTMGRIDNLQVPGPQGPIPLRVYQPLNAQPGAKGWPVLVYFHGGGWVIGDIDTHDVLCRQLANASGCAVVSVDYRLGPEHRFPCAVDDCFAATRWVNDNAAQLGLDPSRLAVGGDSAGGNLAAVVSLLARDAGDLPIRFQLLIYPSTDMRATSPSHKTNGQGYLLTSDSIDYYQSHYVGNPALYADWRASPLLAASHANLPPAFVLTAGYDPLRDEGLAYAQKLSDAGVQSTHVSFERQIHGFITMGRLLKEANVAVRLCAMELKATLG